MRLGVNETALAYLSLHMCNIASPKRAMPQQFSSMTNAPAIPPQKVEDIKHLNIRLVTHCLATSET